MSQMCITKLIAATNPESSHKAEWLMLDLFKSKTNMIKVKSDPVGIGKLLHRLTPAVTLGPGSHLQLPLLAHIGHNQECMNGFTGSPLTSEDRSKQTHSMCSTSSKKGITGL